MYIMLTKYIKYKVYVTVHRNISYQKMKVEESEMSLNFSGLVGSLSYKQKQKTLNTPKTYQQNACWKEIQWGKKEGREKKAT